MPLICRHNRFTAECPICSKGTVLDSSRTAARRPSRPARERKPPAAAPGFERGPYAAAGPYGEGTESFEVRLDRVPGGLRLASWAGGSIRRAAPVLAAGDLPALLLRAADADVLGEDGRRLLDAARGAAAGEPGRPGTAAGRAAGAGGYGASPGRTGELNEELRVEPLDGGRLRIGRWILRPGSGWQLQEAPVMLPASRYAEALERAVAAGALPSD